MKFGPALQMLTQKAWALEPAVLNSMARIFVRHAQGVRLTDEEIAEAVHAERAARGRSAEITQSPGYQVQAGVAIVPIYGVIAKRADMVNGASQPRGTSCDAIRRDLAAAVNDPDVHAILLDIDSPGGSVDGIAETGDAIFNARQRKHVCAFADGLMCSAAYWLGSQAHEIYGGKTAVIGSIGVYSVWVDSSKAHTDAGFKISVVRSGELKGAGTPGTEITDKQFAKFQRSVDAFADVFRTAVAVGRDLSEDRVAELADGDVHIGEHAVSADLMDGLKTYEQVLADLQARPFSDKDRARGDSAGRDGRAGETESEGATAMDDKDRLKALKEAFPADAAFVLEQYEAGHDVTQAKAAKSDELAAENERLKAALAQKTEETASAAIGNKPLRDESAGPAVEGCATEQFNDAVAAEMAKGVTRYAALATVAKKHRHLRQAMLAEVNSRHVDKVDALFKR